MSTKDILPLFCLLNLSLAPALLLSSCAGNTWPVEEYRISRSLEKTTADAVIICWEKPVEEYQVLSEMKVSLTPEQASDPAVLAEVVNAMREKAAKRGANGLLLRNRKHSALYRADNRINIKNFILKDGKTTLPYLESKAVWIEENRGTHGGDEGGAETKHRPSEFRNVL